MKLIIAGSRSCTSEAYPELLKAIARLDPQDLPITEVVSGGCTGADQLGERWARENGVLINRFEAKWATYGLSAGPRRNRQMAEYGEFLILLRDGDTPGSRNMLKEAVAHRLPVMEVWLPWAGQPPNDSLF